MVDIRAGRRTPGLQRRRDQDAREARPSRDQEPGPARLRRKVEHRRSGLVTWALLNLANLEERPAIQPTLGGVGLVYPGKRHVFSGPPESAKTLAAYAIALAEIRQGGTVVLIDLEMGQWDARDRLRELGATAEDF